MSVNQKTLALLGVIFGELSFVVLLSWALMMTHPAVYVVAMLAWMVLCIKVIDPRIKAWLNQ